MNLQAWLPAWLDSVTCQQIGTALVHFLWQAAALCAIAVGIVTLLKDRSSHFRYALNVACLIAMAGCVPMNLAFMHYVVHRSEAESQLASMRSADTTFVSESKSASRSAGLDRPTDARREEHASGERSVATVASFDGNRIPSAVATPLTVEIGSSVVGELRPQSRFATWLVSVWIVGAVVMLLRLLTALLAGWRLAYGSRPVTQAFLLHAAKTQAHRLGLTARPALAWCDRVSVPMVLGILRPIVLLPPSLLTGLDTAQLEAILAHEFAHIRRFDPLVNVLQRVIEAVFFFHPAVWYVSRQVSDERENCCDDVVIRKGTNRFGYADALVRMAEVCAEQRVPATSLAATGRRRSDLKRRILRLVASEPTVRPGSGFLLAVAMAGVALVVHGALLRAEAPEEEAKTTQQAAGHPDDLVAVLGEDRARIWGYPKQVLVTSDEQRLFLTESIGYVSIFDANSLRRIAQFRPHPTRCLDIALLNSDTRLISISLDGAARLWDVTGKTPKHLDTFQAFDGTANPAWLSMSVANKGQRAAIRSDEEITLLEARDNKLHVLATIPQRGEGTPFNYALSPDGRWLVACEDQETRDLIKTEIGMYFYLDAILAVWDLSGEKPVLASELKRKTVQQLAFAPDGQSFFGVDPSFLPKRETHQWSFVNGKISKKSVLPGVISAFSSTVFNADGTRLVLSTKTGLQVFEKSNSGWEQPKNGVIAASQNASCAFLEDDSLIVASSPELQRWDYTGGRYKKRPGPSGHSAAVMGLMFDARTNTLLSAGKDAIREWSLAEMSAANTESSELDFDDVVKMWPWGEKKGFLLRRSVEGANVIEGVRRSGNKMVSQFKLDFTSDYRQSAWSAVMHPTQDILATGHWDSKIRVWDVSVSPPEKLLEWEAHRGHVCDVAFSPDGKQLASVGWDSQTYVWEVDSFEKGAEPKRRHMGKHLDIVRSVAWSPDGRFVASGGEDGQILLWDISNPEFEQSLTHAEDGPVKKNSYDSKTVDTLQFSRDGTRLLSGDGKGRVTVWSLKDMSIEKRWLLSGWIWDAKFSPDEKMIATANYDGTIYLLRSPKR